MLCDTIFKISLGNFRVSAVNLFLSVADLEVQSLLLQRRLPRDVKKIVVLNQFYCNDFGQTPLDLYS